MNKHLEDVFSEHRAFDFSDEEIAEYLANSGAGPQATALVTLIAAVTHRNPSLVSAVIHHLRSIRWGTDSQEVLEVLFNREFSAETLANAQRTVSRYVTNPAAKQLLYRLSLVDWGLSFPQVQAVGEVATAIESPFEAFQYILNQWVQSSGAVFYISPLLHNIGENNLEKRVIQDVHRTLAQSILALRTLDLPAATRCISSFLKGKDYGSAGLVLTSLYKSAETTEQAKSLRSWGLLTYWKELDIPGEMPLRLRVLIRYEQIRLLQLLGLETDAFQNWLKQYADDAATSLPEGVLVKLLTLINSAQGTLTDFWRDATFVIRNRNVLATPPEEALLLLPEVTSPADWLGAILWVPIHHIRSDNDVVQWLALADLIQEDTGISSWQNDIAESVVTIISHQIAETATETSVDAVLNTLNTLSTYFSARHFERLQAVASSASITVRFQQLGDRLGAVQLVEDQTALFVSPEARYLLYATLGKLFYNAGEVAESVSWLTEAVEMNCDQQDSFIEVLVYAAAAVSAHDSTSALQLLSRAADLAADNKLFPELDYLQLLAEVALAYWLHHDIEQSFIHFEQVVDRLLAATPSELTQPWTRLYVLLRHVVGYIAPTSARDQVPEHTADGKDYVVPFQGIFSFNKRDLSDLYKAKPAPHVLFYLMALFAEGVGDIVKAYEWSQRAFDAARQAGDDQALLMISGLCGQYALVNAHYAEGLEAFLLFAGVFEYVKKEPGDKEQVLANLKISDLYKQKPSQLWNIAEASAVLFAVVPMVISTLTAQLENRHDEEKLTLECQQAVDEYASKASDLPNWSIVSELITQVLDGLIPSKTLLKQSEAFRKAGQKNLQIICLLGVIARTTDGRTRILQLLDVLPYLTKVFASHQSIVKFILAPFTKWLSKSAVAECFVGTRKEVASLLTATEAISLTEPYAVQLMLQSAVEAADLTVPEAQHSWLYDFQEI